MTHVSEALVSWLWRTSWQAGLLVMVILAAQRLFRNRLSPRARYALWFLLVLKLALPLAPTSSASLFNLIPPSRTPITLRSSDHDPVSAGAATDHLPVAKPDTTPPALAALFPVREMLFMGWLAGAMFFSARILYQNLCFSRMVRRADLVADPALLGLLQACRKEVVVNAPVALVRTDAVKTPGLCGYFRPTILLPRNVSWVPELLDLRHIFLHELSHIKRRDMLVHWLCSMLRVVHWFNPVVWFGFKRMAADRELACDELALSRATRADRRSYGETILRLMEQCVEKSGLPGMVGILEDRSDVERRITMIARFHPCPRRSVLGAALFILLGLVTLTGAESQVADPASSSEPQRVPSRRSAEPEPLVSAVATDSITNSIMDLNSMKLARAGMLEKLANLHGQEAALLGTYKEAHPRVQAVRGEIALLEKQKVALDDAIKAKEEANREAARMAFLRRYGLVDPTASRASRTNALDSEIGLKAREEFMRRYGLVPTQPATNPAPHQTARREIRLSSENVPLLIQVDAQGQIRIGQQAEPLSFETLKARLAEEARKNPDLQISISADKSAPFGQIIKAMDAAKAANVKFVNAFATESAAH